MADQFCLRWNNFQANIVSALDSLKCSEDLVDVTLTCEGRSMKAHKVILSACSPYFKTVFKDNPCQHPIIILKDVLAEDMINVLEYMYQGEVYIEECKLSSFLNTAALLQIKGLTGSSTPQNHRSPTRPSCSNHNPVTPAKLNHTNMPKLLKKRRASFSEKNHLNSEPVRKQKMTEEVLPDKQRETLKKLPEIKCSYIENNNNLEMKHNDKLNVIGRKEPERDTSTVKSESQSDSGSPKGKDGLQSVNDDSRNDSDDSQDKYENSMLARSLLTGIHHTKPDSNNTTPIIINNNNSASTQHTTQQSSNEQPPMKMEQISDEETEPEVVLTEHPSNTATAGMMAQVMASNPGQVAFQLQANHAAICGDCPHCGKKYSNQSALKYHVRLMHSDLTNRLCCYLCPSAFTMRETFKEHMWNTHGQRN